MKKRMLGVIDATTYHEGLEELTVHRSLAAVPFAGRYRLIDFVLSNMVNSDIESVAIFPKYQYRSLMDHLGSGKNWDLNRKRDGLFFFRLLCWIVLVKGSDLSITLLRIWIIFIAASRSMP